MSMRRRRTKEEGNSTRAIAMKLWEIFFSQEIIIS